MKRYDKLTFISRSDTCRAPMAEALMQAKLLLEDILVDTRGMIALFPEPVNPKAMEIINQNGLPLEEHEAVQLTKDDFDERTLMLTMEEAQKAKILEEYPDTAKNVYTLSEYCGRTGDVESPFGKDSSAYGECFFFLKDLIEKLAEILKEEEENDSDSM